MAKLSLKAGSTSVDINIFIQDSSSTTGAGLTGLVFNSAGLTAYYHRQGAATAVAFTLATKTVGTWATEGFVAVDGTNMPGVYELGIPNLALATGAKWVFIMLRGATNMAPLPLEIELTATDNQDATRGGMTALPNFNAGVASGLPVLDANLTVDADLERVRGTVINALVANRMDSSVGAVATGAIGAAAFAAGAIDAAAIADNAIDAAALAADVATEIRSIASGTSDSGTTTTMVDAARTEADTDYWKGRWILFTSGAISGQTRLITAFNAVTDTITFAPATTQAVGTQTYEILPAGAVDLRLVNSSAINNLIGGRVDAEVGAYTSGQAPLQPTVAGRTLDVAATGEAGLDFDNIKQAVGATTLTNITIPTVTNLTTNNDKTGYALSAAGVQAVWDALTSALTVAGSIGKRLSDNVDVVLSTRAATGAAMTLTAGERDSVADALLDRANGIETGLTPRQSLRVTTAACAGKSSGLATTTPIYRNAQADTLDRITATVDANGNRTAVTLILT